MLGGDDGFLHVWDLRRFQDKTPVAIFKHHTEAVTTVEWHPKDSAVFASGGSDNQIALWDLSVERDQDASLDIEVNFFFFSCVISVFLHTNTMSISSVVFIVFIPLWIFSSLEMYVKLNKYCFRSCHHSCSSYIKDKLI